MQILLMVVLLLTALFLIVLVLVQRGKGGGLAGAFGGMGGQSAFGTKAGDLFTKITISVATFWILLCMVTVRLLSAGSDPLDPDVGGGLPPKDGMSAPVVPGEAPEGGGEAPAAPGGDAPADQG
jgi:preprotein translocase subunit SecG